MLEDIIKNVSIVRVALVIVVCFFILQFKRRMQESSRIKKLGLRAPFRTSWVPFGLDIAYGGAMSVIRNGTLQYFEDGKKLSGFIV
jgi:hypothetical protein